MVSPFTYSRLRVQFILHRLAVRHSYLTGRSSGFIVCSVSHATWPVQHSKFASPPLETVPPFTAPDEIQASVVTPPETPVYQSSFLQSSRLKPSPLLDSSNFAGAEKLFHLSERSPEHRRNPRQYRLCAGISFLRSRNAILPNCSAFGVSHAIANPLSSGSDVAMNSGQLAVFGVVFVAFLLATFSLWENPLDGRSPRQRRGGIFHTLRSGLLRSFFTVYCGLCFLLYRLGAPAWLVNSVRLIVPGALLRACARAFHERNGGQA